MTSHAWHHHYAYWHTAHPKALRSTPHPTSDATLPKQNFLRSVFCFVLGRRLLEDYRWVLTTYHHANVGYNICIIYIYMYVYTLYIFGCYKTFHSYYYSPTWGFPTSFLCTISPSWIFFHIHKDTTLDIQIPSKKAVNFQKILGMISFGVQTFSENLWTSLAKKEANSTSTLSHFSMDFGSHLENGPGTKNTLQHLRHIPIPSICCEMYVGKCR